MAKEYAKGFYNSTRWQRCRSSYLSSQHHICERCGEQAEMIHHIKSISPLNIDDPSITLDWNNLQALCDSCHGVVHGCDEVAGGVRIDAEGNIYFKDT